LAEALDRYERELIVRALSAAKGNVADAARKLATEPRQSLTAACGGSASSRRAT